MGDGKKDFETLVREAYVKLDAAQERAPIDVAGYLDDINDDIQLVLERYRENRTEAEDES